VPGSTSSLERSLNALVKRQLTPANFGEAAITLVADRSGAEVAVVLRWDPDLESLSFLASAGLESKVLKFLCEKVGNRLGVECLRSRESKFISDVHADAAIPHQLAAGIASEGGLALAAIPLLHEGSPTGMVLLFAPHPGVLSPGRVEKLVASLSTMGKGLVGTKVFSAGDRRTAEGSSLEQLPQSATALLMVSGQGETSLDGTLGLDIGKIRKERQALRSQIADMRRSQGKIRKEAEAREAELQSALREIKARMREAATTEEALKKEQGELQEALREALKASTEERSRMEAELATIRKQLANAEEGKADLEARMGKVRELQTEIEAGRAVLTDKDQVLEDLTRERDEIQQQLNRARVMAGRRTRDSKPQQAGAEVQDSQLEELNESLAASMATRLHLEVEMSRVREQVTAEQGKRAELEARLEQTTKDLNDARAETNESKTRSDQAQSEAALVEKDRYRVAELRAELKSLRISNADLLSERDEALAALQAGREGTEADSNGDDRRLLVEEERPPELSGAEGASDTRRVRVDAARFEALLSGLTQLGSTRERMAEEFRALIALSAKLRSWPERLEKTQELEAEGEAGEVKNGIEAVLAMVQETSAISEELNRLIDSLATEGGQFYELSSGLEREVDSLRLVPLEAVYRRLRRPVRDAARQTGKLVDFVLRGGELQVDRSLADGLYSPLLHLVRNAVTHGIQLPDFREQRGKPRRGWVCVAAEAGSGELTVTVKDDGAGIDLDKVFAKGVKNRLIDPSAEPNQDELLALIFRQGFSTSDEVNDLAGRGVGMDVVAQQAKTLGGRVDIDTEEGRGTAVSLTFPLPAALSEEE